MGRHGPVAVLVSGLWSTVRPLKALVLALLNGASMRAVKLAIAAALAADTSVSALVPGSQIFSVERATVPTLPAVELIGVTSERVNGGMTRDEVSVECTVSHPTEDGADLALDAIVRAIRVRLMDAEHSTRPIALASGEGVLVVVQSVRWSVSAADGASTIRGASIALSVEASE